MTEEIVKKNNDLPSGLGTPSAQLDNIDARELGATGLRRFSGFIYEEFLPELTGWQGVRTYTEMKSNDPVVGACLFAIKTLCRKVKWFTEPGSDDPEDVKASQFFETCLNDMSQTWIDTVDEILSMLEYGHCANEIVYKKREGNTDDPATRSDYKDGYVGWRKLSIRSQDTIYRWRFDDTGGILGFEQLAPPYYLNTVIPIEKLLLFRTTISKNNPEGRPLTLDTLVPTPQGWSTISDLQVGDQVYDETGAVRSVVGKSDVFQNRPVYEIKFSTGHTVKADASHLWSVTTANDRFNNRPAREMTTESLVAEIERNQKQHFSCGGAVALDCKPIDLPVDPYILGYWLGNGKTTGADLACHKEDACFLIQQVKNAGYRAAIHDPGTEGATLFVSGGLITDLRACGVLGDKHIPRAYLRASQHQRLALLQGLMDSDGYSPGELANDSASFFHNVNRTLIDQVAELVRTLGGRPGVTLRQLAGRKGGEVKGHRIVATRDLYEVRFHLALTAHRLPRKASKQNEKDSSRTTQHFIKSITRVKNADTQCIEVDSPSHLFLCGKGMVPTHNSILRSAYRPWYMKKNIENIEAIGVERDLAGLPVAYVPPEILSKNASEAEKNLASAIRNIVINIRRNSQEGILFPQQFDQNGKPLWDLKLLSTGGSRQFNTNEVINRYDQRIAMTMLADFILLGQDKAGSYALSSTKTNLFSTAIGAFLDIICDVMNRYAVPRLFALNPFKIKSYPKLKHGDLGAVDLNEVGQYIQRLSQAGMPLFPNNELEKYLLDVASVPTATLTDQEKPLFQIDPTTGDSAKTGAKTEGLDDVKPAGSQQIQDTWPVQPPQEVIRTNETSRPGGWP